MGNRWTKTRRIGGRAKSWPCAALALAALIFSTPLAAQGISERLWGSIGVVKVLGHGTCNGVLIASDRIVTAAHCVFSKTGERVDPKLIWFENGPVKGQVQKNWRAQEVSVPRSFKFGTPFAQNGQDVAVVRLANEIPSAIALPFVMASAPIDPLDLGASYQPANASEIIHQVCSLTSMAQAHGVLDCVVQPGASGGAIVHFSADGPILVGIIGKAGETTEGPVTIFAPVGQGIKGP